MAEKITIRFITPKDMTTSEGYDSALLPTPRGGLAILPKRAPLAVEVSAGKIVLYKGYEEEIFYTTSGIAETSDNFLNISSELIIPKKDVNIAALQERKDAINKSLAGQTSPMIREELKGHLTFIDMVIKETSVD